MEKDFFFWRKANTEEEVPSDGILMTPCELVPSVLLEIGHHLPLVFFESSDPRPDLPASSGFHTSFIPDET